MYDLHSHILPNIDDGARSFKESLKMLQIAKSEGVTTIAATPHFFLDGTETSQYYNAKKQLGELRLFAVDRNINIRIKLGFELMLNESIFRYPFLSSFAIEDTILLLFETKNEVSIELLKEAFYYIKSLGLVPVLAHPERHSLFINNPLLLKELCAKGLWFQINTPDISGTNGIAAAMRTKRLAKSGMNFVLGSDAHSPVSRKPEMNKAYLKLQKWIGVQQAFKAAQVAPKMFFRVKD